MLVSEVTTPMAEFQSLTGRFVILNALANTILKILTCLQGLRKHKPSKFVIPHKHSKTDFQLRSRPPRADNRQKIRLTMSKPHVHIVNDEIVVLVIMAESAPTSHVRPEVELVC